KKRIEPHTTSQGLNGPRQGLSPGGRLGRIARSPSLDELKHMPPERGGDDRAHLERRAQRERRGDEARVYLATGCIDAIGREGTDVLCDDARVDMRHGVRALNELVCATRLAHRLANRASKRER